jgi:hypothetical protein
MVVKTTKITIETESLLVVHKGRTLVAWCQSCDAETEVMTLEGESFLQETSSLLVSDWLAAGQLHSWKTEDGQAHICLASLHRCFDSVNARAIPKPQLTFTKQGIENEHD